jgi:hypothetical protein
MTNMPIPGPFVALYLPLSRQEVVQGETVRPDSGVGLSTRIRRRVGLVGAVVCLVGAAVVPGAQADRRPAQQPEELWRAYPLEQTPTTSAPAPASPARTSPNEAPSTSDSSPSDPPWLPLGTIAVASALLAGMVWALRRRRRAAAVADSTRPPVPGPMPPSPAVAPPPPPAVAQTARTTPTATVRPNAATPGANAATVRTNAATPGANAAAAQANARASAPGAGTNGRTPARSKGPVCQIHWSRRGRWFYAVKIDPDGAEHRIGRSPRVDCDEPVPPETPEARAALRQLVKDLRQGGWRPLRARGIDFKERRWYARRFRWPTEAEMLAGDPDASDRTEEVAGPFGGQR